MNRKRAFELQGELITRHFSCDFHEVDAGRGCDENVFSCVQRRMDANLAAMETPCEVCGLEDGTGKPMGCPTETHCHGICERCAQSKTLRVTGRLEMLRVCPLRLTDADRAMAVLARE